MNFKRLLAVLMVAIMGFSLPAIAQDKTIVGKVTDKKDGSPLANVSVVVKGSKVGTQTAADGSFKLKVPAGTTTISISSVGFATQEVAIGAGDVSVSLVASDVSLNEVIVIGYGTAKKKDLTGSVASISSKDFVKGAITTPEQLISGKVAGVSITPNGGAPGSGSVIRIRGGASINGSNDPLIIVDGVPLDNGGIAGSPNALSLINPNDIENFTILKDASSTAIYGSRASNGVIIITTKKGTTGKPRYSFNSINSLSTLSKKVDVLSADEFRTIVNANGTASQKALLGTANTDWQDAIYQNAFTTDNNLSVSGTTNNKLKMPYRLSLGYLNQDGILKTGSLQRTSLAFNLNPKFFKNTLKVDLNFKGSSSRSRFANEGAIGSAVRFDPTKLIYSGSNRFGGFWEWLDPSTISGLRALTPLNPLGMLEQQNNRSHVDRSIGNIQFDYQIPFVKGLRANLNMGYDYASGSGDVIINDSAAMSYQRFQVPSTGVRKSGVRNQYSQEKVNTLLDFYLNYVKEISAGRFELTGGYSFQHWKSTNNFFPDQTFDGTVVNTPTFPNELQENLLIGVYGRLNYSYKGRYLLTATMRRDGSSRFAPENRWGNFPSAAIGWNIKEESFLKNARVISQLKLTGGFGVTGQQDGFGNYSYIGNYFAGQNQARYQLGNNYFNLLTASPYNASIRWEQTEMWNAGIEFGFYNNRITGKIEYYNRNTKDLLNPTNLPGGSNFTNQLTANVGTLKNEGIELTLNANVVNKKDLQWDISANITYNKNTITNLTLNPDPNFPGNTFGGISIGTGSQILINSLGHPRGAFYVYRQVYDKAGKPLEGLVDDLNRDGFINISDRYRYKQIDPVIFMGVSSSLTYKKWSASFVARGNFGNYLYNNVHSANGTLNNVLSPLGNLNNASRHILESNFVGGGNTFYLSDYYVENASFIRMDNIALNYNIGKVFSNKAEMRIGVNVQNAFIITKYKGLDPEVFGGIDNNLYPRPRVFVLNIGINF